MCKMYKDTQVYMFLFFIKCVFREDKKVVFYSWLRVGLSLWPSLFYGITLDMIVPDIKDIKNSHKCLFKITFFIEGVFFSKTAASMDIKISERLNNVK